MSAPTRVASASPFDRLPPRSGPAGPLSGVRVLDLSAYIAGPYGCSLLADQGAEVLKIEPPDGDNLRKYPSSLAAESRAFLGVNRSKYGLVLDLKCAEGRAALERCLTAADVLVHNFRPGVPERLGIAYADLQARHPRLIYCAVTGYGEHGPLAGHAGYDQVLQTRSGMCVQQGKPGGAPEILYGSVVDYYAAALLSAGVASALYERERSGVGQYVGVPCCAARWRCSRRAWCGRRTSRARSGATCVRAASPASIRRAKATFTSRPTPRISGVACARKPACMTCLPTRATRR